MKSLKFVSEIQSDGTLQVPFSLLRQLGDVKKIQVTLNPLINAPKVNKAKDIDQATLELLDMIRQAPDLGMTENNNLLRHSVLMEEYIDERLIP